MFKIFERFTKEKPTEIYVQVIANDDSIHDNVILGKIGEGCGEFSIPLIDLPYNQFKCSAYRITIEPIEHTFEKPCDAWKKAYTPKILNIEEHKQKMKVMFGISDDQ